MNKEKEIAEIENFIAKNKTVETSEWLANGLYNMGYRKSDEVRKETAKEILQDLYDGVINATYVIMTRNSVKRFAEKYGVEVDE